MSSESISILKKSGVNVTKPRMLILDAFLCTRQSLDPRYFLREHGFKFERTTVFRTLRILTKKKIIYRVSALGSGKYLLYRKGQTRKQLPDHSSFVCLGCGKAVPLETITAARLKIPKGFTRKNMEIIIHGFCPLCRSRSKICTA